MRNFKVTVNDGNTPSYKCRSDLSITETNYNPHFVVETDYETVGLYISNRIGNSALCVAIEAASLITHGEVSSVRKI